MASLPGFKVNAQTIGLVMGIVGFATVCINVYNWFLAGRAENAPVVKELSVTVNKTATDQAAKDAEQDARLDRTDRDRARATEAQQKLTDATINLDKSVTRLTTVMEQNGLMQPTKKAEWHFPETTRPASYEVTR